MKRIIFLTCLLIASLSACKKETSEPANRLLSPGLFASRTATVARLQLGYFGYKPILPFTVEDPENYEVYQSKADLNHFEKIATVPYDTNGFQTFDAVGLETGESYFFFVKAIKKGLDATETRRVMVIPTLPESIGLLLPPTSFDVLGGSVPHDGQTLAYVNRFFVWNNGESASEAVFTYDFGTMQHTLIDTIGTWPDWSADGKKIVFCTGKNEVSDNFYSPQQLAIHDFVAKTTSKITQGKMFALNPAFSPDGLSIAFVSDEGHPNEFDIWKINTDGTQKTRLTNGLIKHHTNGNIEIGRPNWSPDGKSIFYGIKAENPDDDGIYQIDLQDNSVKAIVESQWDDLAPSVSPDGKKLAFLSNRSGMPEVWLMDLGTKKLRQITGTDNQFLEFSWSKIEWLDDSKLMFGGFDGSAFQVLYQLEI